MQQFLSGSSLFVHALMQRQVDKRLLLVIEGEDEETVLVGHINNDDVALLMAGGKPAVLEAAHLISSQGLLGARALIDRDLDDLTGASASYPSSLVATNGYDFVTDIVASRPDLFERTCRSHGKRAMEKHLVAEGIDLTDSVYALTLTLAAVRLINAEKDLGLNLRDFPFSSLDRGGLSAAPFAEFFDVAVKRSKVSPAKDEFLKEVPAAVSRLSGDRKHCGGHDLMRAAATLLRWSGQKKAVAASMEASLYTAVDCLTIQQLAFVAALQTWAAGFGRSALAC